MRKTLTTAVILLAATFTLPASAMAQQTDAAKPSTASSSTTHKAAKTGSSAAPELKTDKEKASYAIGMGIGGSLRRDDVDIDFDVLTHAMKDAIAGNKLLMTEDEAKAAMTKLQKDVKEKKEAKMKLQGEENKKEGETFLAANKSKEGVVTLPSGLQYKVEKQGDGPKPVPSDTVECNYRGTLINGKEFDSSFKRGKPASFPVSGVIAGWTEILQLMPVGSKYQIFVPSELAYKERGAGADIGPNSTLIFEIELLSIKDKPAAASAAPAAPKPADAAKPTDAAKPAEPAK
jgi:FKBP-type peptidyl-prolyl cis-trans isomerase